MDPIDLLQACIPAFERAQIGYFVTGSVASALYGEHRYTNDVDVIVHLEAEDADIVCACFPEPEFYLSREAVGQAIARAGMFNVIHPSSGFKIDFVVSGLSELDRAGFARVRRQRLGSGLEVLLASPEDVVVSKLNFYKQGDLTSTSATSPAFSACSAARWTAPTLITGRPGSGSKSSGQSPGPGPTTRRTEEGNAMAEDKFHWLDVQRIAEELADNHPDIAAYSVTFPDLRKMVEALEGFEEQQGHPVNERILEEIQRLWQSEADELPQEDEDEE